MEEKTQYLSVYGKPQESRRAIKSIPQEGFVPAKQLPYNLKKYSGEKSEQGLEKKKRSVDFQNQIQNQKNGSGVSQLMSSEETIIKINKDCKPSTGQNREEEIRKLFMDLMKCVNYHFSKYKTENAGSRISERQEQMDGMEVPNNLQISGNRYEEGLGRQKGQVFGNYRVIMDYQFIQDNHNEQKIVLQNTGVEIDDCSESLREEFDFNHN